MRARLRLRLLLVALTMWVGWACTETLVSVIDVAVVEIEPQEATIFVDDDVTLEANVRDSRGNVLSGRDVRWTSETPGVAAAGDDGVVHGVAPGSATVAAVSEGIRGTARITVLARPALHMDADSVVLTVVRGDVPSATNVSITNAGGGTLTGVAAVTEYETGADWLETSLSASDAPATLVLTPVTAELTPGTYRATIRITAVNASNGTLLLPVRLELLRPAPAQIAVAGGNNQSATVATEVSEPLSVLVTDANGAPVEDVAVSWTVSAGGGSLSSADPVLTSNAGIAVAPTWRLGTNAGPNTLTASAEGLGGTTAVFTATAVPGAAAKLAIVTPPPSSTRSGAPFTTQPVIQLTDGFGNAVAQQGIAVTAVVAGGDAALGGAVTIATNDAGAAVFTDLSITGPAGERTLQFTSPFHLPTQQATIAVVAGSATRLTISMQPSASAVTGAAFGEQPIVRLADNAGNNVAESGVIVTANIETGAGTLGGTVTAVTGADGLARFSDLVITGLAGARTLAFTAPGLTRVVSATIDITTGPATRLSLITQPPVTASSGSLFSRHPVVQLMDVGGNAVTQPGVEVTAAIASGGGTLGGTLSAITDAMGRSSFDDLWIAGTAGNRTLEFTAAPLAPVTSSPIAITTGAGTQLSLATAPLEVVQSGIAFERQPVIQLRDAGGNAVGQAGVLISVTIESGGGTLGGTLTATTNSAGSAAFVDLKITGLAGERVLEFAASGITPISTAPVAVIAGPAARLSFTSQPPAQAQSGVAFAQPTVVQLRDEAGNAVEVAGVEVTAAIASGGGSLNGDLSAATDASGAARFSDLSIAGTVGDRTLEFTTPGLASASSHTISLAAGPASPAASSASVPNGTAGAPTVITILVRDASDNPVSGAAGLLTVSVSGANTATPAIVDAGNGSYTATYSPAAAGTDHISLALAGTALNGSPFASVVSPGGVSSTGSSVAATPATGLVADGSDAATVTVTVRDAIGNPIGGLAGAFSVGFDGTASADAVAETSTAGTYMFKITSTLANTVALLVTVSGTLLAESPTVEFVPGAIASASSSAAASPATGVAANGIAASIVTINLADAFGNAVTGLDDTDFNIQLSSTTAQRTTITENGGGAYQFSVTNLVAEEVTVTVTAGGVLLNETPIIEFVPGGVDPTQSTIVPDRTTGVTANGTDASTVELTLVDSNGNPIDGLDNSAFTIGLTSGTASAVTETAPNTGIYSFTVTNTNAETVTVTVTVQGTELDANPTIGFVPGPVAASSSVVPNRTSGVTADGVDASAVTVMLVDANGNEITGAAGSFSVAVSNGGTAGTVTEGTAGTYTFNVTNTTAGVATVTVTVGAVELDTKPTIGFVASEIVSASASTVVPDPTTDVTANGSDASAVEVVLRDANNNLIAGIAGSISVVVSGSGAAGSVTETAPGSGTYTFNVTNTVAEQVTVTVTANGVVLTAVPTITFEPGPVSASVSTAVPDRTTDVTADGVDFSTVLVTVSDANGNEITGLAGSIVVQTTGGTVGTVTEMGTAGVYSFTVTHTVAETVTLTITAGTVELDANPTITFVAGAVDADNSSVVATPTQVVTGN